MKRLLMMIVCVLVMLPASFAREVTLYTIEDFFDTVSIRGASFSADGNRILVSSDVSGIFNARLRHRFERTHLST